MNREVNAETITQLQLQIVCKQLLTFSKETSTRGSASKLKISYF